MPARDLPLRPNLEQYKKQAKELVAGCRSAEPESCRRLREHHPRLARTGDTALTGTVTLADAQVVIAREHGFESWPKFAAHLETRRLTREVESLTDPVTAFIIAACVPRDAGHASGTLEHAEMILARYPDVARRTIHVAAIHGDEATVRGFLASDPGLAITAGGPYAWDPLTYLCFSRYLRLDTARSDAYVATARALLDAGASARTGWYETIDHPNQRPAFESALYGAAGVAHHPALTRLLLERGADPNDEETPYHAPEDDDNGVMTVLLESGALNGDSRAVMLLRKSDWHDPDGLRLLLEHGADPRRMTQFGYNGLHQAIRRDNSLPMIELLLDHRADPALNNRDGRSAVAMAARRGRRSVLELFARRGHSVELQGVDRLIAACAMDDEAAMRALIEGAPQLVAELRGQGGTLLAEFSGVGNAAGVRRLLDCGVGASALYEEGDGYFGIARNSTALHVAAWRAWPDVVKLLIASATPVDAADGQGRTALMLAVKACVDSHWTTRRSPASVKALLEAGASIAGIDLPSGYDEVDALLRQHAG